ncbi:HAD family hydrolase [Mesorhizobium sp. M2E.F.Ca.ET.209.01.1.1]|uniref:HAD family hydrolase n=2 Tax=unclassified Mesorhizobium TaxID=325217 RepID=UPI000FDBE95C|nr:HAD family hydrolase [Mesorhizobium sp. M2E.F.Ca.ET.209.01.1.1]TGS10061.1 HAD family hydrolase [Mesorhizobium sp. M2E.F.Ca.ET.209.01.1.1]
MKRKIVDTLIIDLDNTIYDWFAIWYSSFNPIYEEIIRTSGKSVEDVQKSIRDVHQRRRTSEYTFLIEEIDALQEQRQSGDIRKKFEESIRASQQARDKNLKLYPGVFRSLWAIKNSGTKIVAYTESMAFYSAYRLKRVGLDGVIDVLFSPQDHDIPVGVSIEKLRSLPDDFYDLQVTEARHTPIGELKPNPRVLLDIIRSVGSQPDRCAYVGDSIYKDVAMARDARIFDIHAKYGESQRLPEYDLLRSVSHWTQHDVERERAIVQQGADFKPTAILNESFSEIFAHCDFVSFSDAEQNTVLSRKDELNLAVDAWKKTVDVQQHFNDLEMRVRNFAITVVGALIASMSFTYQLGLTSEIWGIVFPAGTVLVAAAICAWAGFYFMDRYWYHVLLKGAVNHAAEIERLYGDDVPSIKLGSTVSEVSRGVELFGFKVNSTRRLQIFYYGGFAILVCVLVALFFAKAEKKGIQTQRIELQSPLAVEILPPSKNTP